MSEGYFVSSKQQFVKRPIGRGEDTLEANEQVQGENQGDNIVALFASSIGELAEDIGGKIELAKSVMALFGRGEYNEAVQIHLPELLASVRDLFPVFEELVGYVEAEDAEGALQLFIELLDAFVELHECGGTHAQEVLESKMVPALQAWKGLIEREAAACAA